jgi:hypothetical protein
LRPITPRDIECGDDPILRDYVKLAAPEPEVLRIIGEESERNGTNALTSRQIDQVIKTTRAQKKKR